MNRRRLLAGAGGLWSALAAGCLGGGSVGTPTRTVAGAGTAPADEIGEFVLWNDDDEPHTVTLVVRGGGKVLVRADERLASGASTRVPNPVTRQGTYRVIAGLKDGTEERVEWRIDSCDSVEYRQVYIDDGGAVEIREMRRTVVPAPECG
ncbi:hypothetical protein BRC97_11735 [Halobacteriales archaeon QS_6_71_20]|nr:MAG: hypothetical protein BRC97_11735 [Halobacteriales archaeon QS_6_71_20]